MNKYNIIELANLGKYNLRHIKGRKAKQRQYIISNFKLFLSILQL